MQCALQVIEPACRGTSPRAAIIVMRGASATATLASPDAVNMQEGGPDLPQRMLEPPFIRNQKAAATMGRRPREDQGATRLQIVLEVVGHGIRRRLGAIGHTELRENARDVVAHRALAEEERLRDFAVGLAFCNKLQHMHFLLG